MIKSAEITIYAKYKIKYFGKSGHEYFSELKYTPEDSSQRWPNIFRDEPDEIIESISKNVAANQINYDAFNSESEYLDTRDKIALNIDIIEISAFPWNTQRNTYACDVFVVDNSDTIQRAIQNAPVTVVVKATCIQDAKFQVKWNIARNYLTTKIRGKSSYITAIDDVDVVNIKRMLKKESNIETKIYVIEYDNGNNEQVEINSLESTDDENNIKLVEIFAKNKSSNAGTSRIKKIYNHNLYIF